MQQVLATHGWDAEYFSVPHCYCRAHDDDGGGGIVLGEGEKEGETASQQGDDYYDAERGKHV